MSAMLSAFRTLTRRTTCAAYASQTTAPASTTIGLPEQAGWGTEVNNQVFMARLRRPLHPLESHRIFNIHTYRHDLLHMADHHGVLSHVIANILWAHLCGERESQVLPGDTIDQRLRFLNDDVKAFYTTHHVQNRLPPFKEDNIKRGSFPMLQGRNVKAANTRSFVPYVLALQQRATRENNSAKNRHMLKVAASVSGMLDVLYNADCFLAETERIALTDHIDRLARHYQKLSADAFLAQRTLWQAIPKFHFVIGHLAQQAALINPTWVQGYSSESMVGTTAQIYAMSQNGPFHSRVQKTVMNKYRIGLRLLMEN